MDRMLADIEALNEEIRKLHEQLTETSATRDLHERLTAGAAEKAEQTADETRKRLRTIVAVVAAGLLIWTPFVAYGAVWFHELQRNTCYPVAALIDNGPVDEPWHCGLFPGTHRHAGQE